jgi:RNase adaptor protein for sRNA GlmZ degradation
MTLWTELRTVSGRKLAATDHLINRWDYARPIIADDAGCHEDEIELLTIDGVDWYCVDGIPYARLVDDFSQSPGHKQAMEEREAITATAAAKRQIEKLEAEVAYLKHEVDVWRDRCDTINEDFDRAIAEFNRTYRDAAE